MHTFDVTLKEYWEIRRAARWLRKLYSLEEIKNGDVFPMFEPYRNHRRFQFSGDDVIIAFMLAARQARIGISLRRILFGK